MATSTNKWTEYNAGTLTAPAVLQHDTDDEGVVRRWIWTGKTIRGPISVEAEADAVSVALEIEAEEEANAPEEYEITGEDGEIIEVTA